MYYKSFEELLAQMPMPDGTVVRVTDSHNVRTDLFELNAKTGEWKPVYKQETNQNERL